MSDYVEEDYALQTVQQNFTAEQHRKCTCFVKTTLLVFSYVFNTFYGASVPTCV